MIKLAYNKENPNLVFEVEDIVRKSINVIGIVEYYKGTLVDTSTVPDTKTLNYEVQVIGFESNWAETPVDLGSTGNINNQNKTASPTTEAQTIVPDAGYTGLNQVDIDAVNIDAAQTVDPTTEEQNITPAADSLGIASVKVKAVTASIDPNIAAENIKQGVSILGVNGALAPGLDIQNGRKVNYKATNSVVPKGTFVKLNTSYAGLAYGYSSSAYVEDMIALNEKYIVSIGGQGSSGSMYGFLAIHEVTESGIIQKYRSNRNELSYSAMATAFLYRVDDTHFVVFQPLRSTYSSSITVYSYENEVLTLLSDTTYSNTQFDPTESNTYRAFTGATYTENDEYLCIHESGYRNNSITSGHKYLYCIKVSKADYSVTLIPSTADINYCYYNLQNIDGHIVGNLTNSIGVIDFDITTGVYTRVNTALGEYGFTNDRVSFAKVNNKILIVFAPNQNFIKYVEMTINQNKSVSLGAPVLFFEDTEARGAIYKFFKKNCVHASNLIVNTFYYSGPHYWAFIIKNENGTITTSSVNILGPAGSYADSGGFGCAVFASINNILVGAPGFQSSSSNPIKIAKYEIDAGLNLNQNDGSAITVETATGVIQGITNEECTTTTAGEVILLNS